MHKAHKGNIVVHLPCTASFFILRDFVDFVIKIHGSRKIIVRTKFSKRQNSERGKKYFPSSAQTILCLCFFSFLYFVSGFNSWFVIYEKKKSLKNKVKCFFYKCDNVQVQEQLFSFVGKKYERNNQKKKFVQM